MTQLIIFLASGAYAGFSPIDPGTVGTLVGILLYLLLPYQHPPLYFLLVLLLIGAAIWLAQQGEIIFGAHDSRHIVIDEIVGFLLAMFWLPSSWGYILAAFFIFRAFDVVKPPPIKRLEKLPGGFGVVLDDVMAGIYTNLVLQVWQLIARLWV